MPRYDHVFVIIEENRTADQILGNPDAPELNRLARQYGLASNYYAVSHPSEPNYVALLGGDTFGITDDDAYFCRHGIRLSGCRHAGDEGYVSHTLWAPNLMQRLAAKGLSWKGYFQSLPRPGAPEHVWPMSGPDEGLYAVKHNGFMFYQSVQSDPMRARKIVGFDVLYRDIAKGTLPAFAHIVPDQCHDMHGLPGCFDEAALVREADRLAGDLVRRITATALWKAPANSAIVITFDEDGGDSATHANTCCGLGPGGGWVATIVVTNHGPRHFSDPTPYSHYSLLRTVEEGFRLDGHLGRANAAAGMAALFAVTKK